MDARNTGALFQLTEKDRQLLALLQANAREPTAALARKLGVAFRCTGADHAPRAGWRDHRLQRPHRSGPSAAGNQLLHYDLLYQQELHGCHDAPTQHGRGTSRVRRVG